MIWCWFVVNLWIVAVTFGFVFAMMIIGAMINAIDCLIHA